MQLEEPGYLVLVASSNWSGRKINDMKDLIQQLCCYLHQERDHQHHERDHPIQHPWEEQEANLFQQAM